MSANFLKRTDLPSITGLDARAPMLPKPKTAVPLVIAATKFPLVYSYARFGFSCISSQGIATPGEYASDKSL